MMTFPIYGNIKAMFQTTNQMKFIQPLNLSKLAKSSRVTPPHKRPLAFLTWQWGVRYCHRPINYLSYSVPLKSTVFLIKDLNEMYEMFVGVPLNPKVNHHVLYKQLPSEGYIFNQTQTFHMKHLWGCQKHKWILLQIPRPGSFTV